MQPLVSLLLVLPLASGDVFFASKKGHNNPPGRGAFCFSNDPGQRVAPIYDLNTIRSGNFSNKINGWVNDWKISDFDVKYTSFDTWNFSRWNDMPQIVLKGDNDIMKPPFDLHTEPTVGSVHFSALAKSLSIFVTSSNAITGPGYVLQLDHINSVTQHKEFRALKCSHVELNLHTDENSPSNCQEIYKERLRLLEDGESWTHFKFQRQLVDTAKNNFEISKINLAASITFSDTAVNPFFTNLRFLSVTTMSLAGIIKLHALPILSPANGEKAYPGVEKFFNLSRSSVLCLEIVPKFAITEPRPFKINLYSGSSINQNSRLNCETLGLHWQCKTSLLNSGSYRVSLGFTIPQEIALIQDCSNQYNVSTVSAEDGTWFKGCQTLPTDTNLEETIVSSLKCADITAPGQDFCKALEQSTEETCQNLDFCVSPENENNCTCWANEVSFLEPVLWGVFCANLGLLVFVTLRWRILLKQNYRDEGKDREVIFERPRLPEPYAANSAPL